MDPSTGANIFNTEYKKHGDLKVMSRYSLLSHLTLSLKSISLQILGPQVGLYQISGIFTLTFSSSSGICYSTMHLFTKMIKKTSILFSQSLFSHHLGLKLSNPATLSVKQN